MTGKENVTSFDLMLCLERSAKAISAASPLLAPAPFLTQALREALATEGPGQRGSLVCDSKASGGELLCFRY